MSQSSKVTTAALLRKAGVPRAPLTRQLPVKGGRRWGAIDEDGLIYETAPGDGGWLVAFDDHNHEREFPTFGLARGWLDVAVWTHNPETADNFLAKMIDAGVTR